MQVTGYLNCMDALKPVKCPNIMTDGKHIYSKNLVPGNCSYGERLVMYDGAEYRQWDPNRSKLAAYLLLSNKSCDIQTDDVVLYLGASTGTTVSHISDIVTHGRIFAIEISKRIFRKLMANVAPRKNILPMIGDARDEDLMEGILDKADYAYCDIAQPDQVKIFLTNMHQYHCRSGMLMLKCRSIDVSSNPSSVLEESIEKIRGKGFNPMDPVDISYYDKDHYAILVRRTD